MQKTLVCNISLSKKLRALLKGGGSILLTSDSIENGKGTALLNLTDSGTQEIDVQDLLNKETSIMVTPISVRDAESNVTVTNLFSSQDNGQQGQRSAIDRLAATTPPTIAQVPHALVKQGEVETPNEFIQTEDPQFKDWVTSLQELMDEVEGAKHKSSNIDASKYSDIRQRAVALEQIEKEESIGVDAYVVNDSCASLTINDLDLMLQLNMPRNIGHISAKRLSSSSELWNLFRQGLIKIISPERAQYLIKNAGGIQNTVVPELEVYSSADEAEYAMAAVGGPKDTVPTQNLSIMDLEGESEEMLNLRTAQSTAQGSARNLSGGTTRRSFHGSGGELDSEDSLSRFEGMETSDRRVNNVSHINPKGMKTISRAKE